MSSLNDHGPLHGLRIVDWTHVLAGPFAGYQLALLGADVIRVEQPAGEDIVRFTAADAELGKLGLGEAFIGQSGGKRSIALDVKQQAGKDALRRLIATADVLLENFRPGKLATLGFDPAALIVEQPRLIVCSITGFGPGSDRRAYDHVVQASCGLMAANASEDGTPRRVGFPLVDYAAGQQAAMAVLAALYRRDRPEAPARTSGEWLQVTMNGAALTLMAPAFIEQLVSGKARPRSKSTAFSGNPMSGTFRVANGWLAIVCNAPQQSDGLLSALTSAGVDADLVSRVRSAAQAANVAETQAALAAALSSGQADDWEALLARWGVPTAAVRSPAEAATAVSPAWPRISLPAFGTSGGKSARVPGIGFRSNLPLTPDALSVPARRGRDTRVVLEELGLSTSEIVALFEAGTAAEPKEDR